MGQHRDEPTHELHPVATDQPGLILHRPMRKLRQVAIVYALLPLLCAGVGGFIAVTLAEQATDRRLAALERDLSERRAANARGNAARDAQIAELRRLVCVFADHAQPRDDQVEAVRIQYGCDGGPYPVLPVPGVTPPPSPPTSGAPPRSSGGAGGGRPVPAPTSGRAVPQPAPRPPSPTRPPPEPRPSLICVDLPLLPPICI